MEEKKELSLNETENVTGGIIHKPDFCSHLNKIPTGEQKEEKGEVYCCVKCDKCGKTFWVKLTDLISPATVIK